MNDKSAQAQLDAIKFEVPLFPHLIQPYGCLDGTREAHALWYYYLCARDTYERSLNPLVLEKVGVSSTVPSTPDYKQLFLSVAQLYGVRPEAMVKCWALIDMQCIKSKVPQLPHLEKYRHDETPEIRLQ
jgi:hypothetical protein